jgi:CRP-like cAMP-binding protein
VTSVSPGAFGRLLGTVAEMGLFRRNTPSPLVVAGFNADELESLAGRHTVIAVGAGELLCRQGRTGAGLFVIIEGSAAVLRNGEPVATVSAGDVVGEMSLLGPRVYQNADVVCLTDTTAAVVSRSEWRSATDEAPSLAVKVQAVAESRR